MGKDVFYTENIFYSNPLIAERLKAAWHIRGVAEEEFLLTVSRIIKRLQSCKTKDS